MRTPLVTVLAAAPLLLASDRPHRTPASITVTIPINAPWTDTGIDVKEGATLCIDAVGDVIYADPDADHHAGPDGAGRGGGCTFVVTDDAVPRQSLVGNVFPRSSTLDGTGFLVGSSYRGRVTRTGRLFLGFNDGAVRCDRSGVDAWGFGGDNHGAFTATITVSCGRPAKPPREPDRPTT